MVERVAEISDHVDHLVLVRSASPDSSDDLSDRSNITVIDVPPARSSYIDNFGLHLLIFGIQLPLALMLSLVTVVKRRRRPTVTHGLDHLVSGAVAAATATICRVPLVISVRGLAEVNYRRAAEERKSMVGRVNYRLLVITITAVLRRANHIITKSEYQQNIVRENYGVNVSISTIPTGVDFDRFDPNVVNPRPFESLLNGTEPDSEHVLLHLGKLNRGKGVDILLKHLQQTASSLPPSVSVLLVGECQSEEFMDEIDSLSEPVSERVTVYPHRVPFEVVPDLIARSTALVLLSPPGREGVPRVLQEACVMETPIIASRVTGIERAFSCKPGCFLVERNSPDEFQEAVLEILEGVTMDREQFRDAFDIRCNYARYAEFYDRVS